MSNDFSYSEASFSFNEADTYFEYQLATAIPAPQIKIFFSIEINGDKMPLAEVTDRIDINLSSASETAVSQPFRLIHNGILNYGNSFFAKYVNPIVAKTIVETSYQLPIITGRLRAGFINHFDVFGSSVGEQWLNAYPSSLMGKLPTEKQDFFYNNVEMYSKHYDVQTLLKIHFDLNGWFLEVPYAKYHVDEFRTSDVYENPREGTNPISIAMMDGIMNDLIIAQSLVFESMLRSAPLSRLLQENEQWFEKHDPYSGE